MIFELFRKAWVEAKGTTLSLRMFEGKPRSLKSLSNSVKASKQLTVVTQNTQLRGFSYSAPPARPRRSHSVDF